MPAISQPLPGRTQVLAASLPSGTVQIIFDGQSTNSNGVNSGFGGSTANIYNMSITTRWVKPLMSCDASQFHHGMYSARSIIDDGFAPAVVLTLDVFGARMQPITHRMEVLSVAYLLAL